jgi:hypothetical protein
VVGGSPAIDSSSWLPKYFVVVVVLLLLLLILLFVYNRCSLHHLGARRSIGSRFSFPCYRYSTCKILTWASARKKLSESTNRYNIYILYIYIYIYI